MNSYFSHDSNARNSDKLLPVRMKYGAEGYGIYFMLLERLREEADYMSIKDYNILAFDLRVDAGKLKTIIEDFGLFTFTKNGECFYSESFKKRMEIKDAKSKKLSEAGKQGAKKRWNTSDQESKLKEGDSHPITKPSLEDGKKRKVKESKGKENKKDSRKPRKRVYEDTSVYKILANYLYEKINADAKDESELTKKPDFDCWANDIRLMIERDKRTEKQVKGMIEWCQSDDFWSRNILSAAKLREKYDVLAKQANSKFKKNAVRQEKLPDWVDKPIPEEKQSPEVQARLEAEIATFLNKGKGES